MISMISSNKQMCEGHRVRLEWVDKIGYSALGAEFTERNEEISRRLDMFIKNPDKLR